MKRSPLRRTGRLTRSPIKKRSPKRAKQNAFDKAVLDDFAQRFIGGPCWVCWIHDATQIHHVCGRNATFRNHRCNLMAVCDSPCHSDIIPGMSVRSQFVLKRMRDPEGYDAGVAQQLMHAKASRRDEL